MYEHKVLSEFISDPEDYNLWDLLDPSVNSTRLYTSMLYALARSQNVQTCMELGAYKGNTSLVLARAMKKNGGFLWVIDHDKEACDLVTQRLEAFDLSAFAQVLHQSSTRITSFPIQLDLIFIDADHSYQGVKADWEIWSEYVSVGGYVAFHDTTTSPGVAHFMKELLPKLRGWEFICFPGDVGLVLVRRVG